MRAAGGRVVLVTSVLVGLLMLGAASLVLGGTAPRLIGPLFGTTILVVAACVWLLKEPALPVTQVVLFSGGVGYFQREGPVEGTRR